MTKDNKKNTWKKQKHNKRVHWHTLRCKTQKNVKCECDNLPSEDVKITTLNFQHWRVWGGGGVGTDLNGGLT
jgi:hypothetical protein